MSARARDDVWYALADVPSAVAVVALALADVANDLHGNALFAAVDTVAAKTGRDRRTVQRALRWLEDARWITPTGRRPNGVVEYRWNGPQGGGEMPPPGAASCRPGGGELPPPGGGESPPKPKEPKVNRARPVENPRVEPSARFPEGRSADRARCTICCDTGWATNGHGHAIRCTHPRFAEAVMAPADAARRMRALIDHRAMEAAPCPDPTTNSSPPSSSPTSRSTPATG